MVGLCSATDEDPTLSGEAAESLAAISVRHACRPGAITTSKDPPALNKPSMAIANFTGAAVGRTVSTSMWVTSFQIGSSQAAFAQNQKPLADRDRND
jgi:hypothetical protein